MKGKAWRKKYDRRKRCFRIHASERHIRTGQSYYINLELGAPSEGILLPRGAFFSETGGTWIFVLSADGKTAHRRAIRIGRQNPRFYEVLDGLQPGERVVLSGYEQFKNCDKLILE